MRRIAIGISAATAIVLVGCGSGSKFENKPRPAVPVNLTVYVNDARVSVSPSSIGAGPIVFIVTNPATLPVSVQIPGAGAARGATPAADTGPINPQATATVKVDLEQGEYTMATGSGGSSLAQQATGAPVHSAHLHIGPPRPSAKNAVLQP
jgi:hypothetical protein